MYKSFNVKCLNNKTLTSECISQVDDGLISCYEIHMQRASTTCRGGWPRIIILCHVHMTKISIPALISDL